MLTSLASTTLVAPTVCQNLIALLLVIEVCVEIWISTFGAITLAFWINPKLDVIIASTPISLKNFK